MRLIDADRLNEVLNINFGHIGGADVLRQLIDIQPTVQAVPIEVLDKIMDEVYGIDDEIVLNPDSLECKRYVRLIKVMNIIDKYRGESKDAGTN